MYVNIIGVSQYTSIVIIDVALILHIQQHCKQPIAKIHCLKKKIEEK